MFLTDFIWMYACFSKSGHQRTFFTFKGKVTVSNVLLQAAVYGIGVMAQCCAKDFYQACIG